MDFTVTQKGLEEQLLGRVIGKEQKALEEQLSDVLEEVNSNTKVMSGLESRDVLPLCRVLFACTDTNFCNLARLIRSSAVYLASSVSYLYHWLF